MLVLNTGRIGIWSVGFVEGRITEELREKHPEQGREPTTNSTGHIHVWHWAGIEPRPYWREASALTTWPYLLP